MKRALLAMIAVSGLMLGGCAADTIGNVQWNPSNNLNYMHPPQGLMGTAPATPAPTVVALPEQAKQAV